MSEKPTRGRPPRETPLVPLNMWVDEDLRDTFDAERAKEKLSRPGMLAKLMGWKKKTK